jgi:hypothetical protein
MQLMMFDTWDRLTLHAKYHPAQCAGKPFERREPSNAASVVAIGIDWFFPLFHQATRKSQLEP